MIAGKSRPTNGQTANAYFQPFGIEHCYGQRSKIPSVTLNGLSFFSLVSFVSLLSLPLVSLLSLVSSVSSVSLVSSTFVKKSQARCIILFINWFLTSMHSDRLSNMDTILPETSIWQAWRPSNLKPVLRLSGSFAEKGTVSFHQPLLLKDLPEIRSMFWFGNDPKLLSSFQVVANVVEAKIETFLFGISSVGTMRLGWTDLQIKPHILYRYRLAILHPWMMMAPKKKNKLKKIPVASTLVDEPIRRYQEITVSANLSICLDSHFKKIAFPMSSSLHSILALDARRMAQLAQLKLRSKALEFTSSRAPCLPQVLRLCANEVKISLDWWLRRP